LVGSSWLVGLVWFGFAHFDVFSSLAVGWFVYGFAYSDVVCVHSRLQRAVATGDRG